MRITPEQLRKHVEATGGSEGERGFACELCPSPRGEAPFDFSIHFHARRWAPSTNRNRWPGPDAIKRYLEVFNASNDAPASDYRNVESKGTISANGRCLRKLFLEIKAADEVNRATQ